MRAPATFFLVGLVCIVQPHAQVRSPALPSFEALSAKADAARDAGQLDQAVALYRQALAKRPTWQEGWWSLGTILYDQDAYASAARAFGRLVAYDPKNGTAHLMLALCEYQLNKNDSALGHIRTAKGLGVKRDNQLVRVLYYHEALLLLRKGRYEDAIDSLKILVEDGVASDEVDAALGLAVLIIRPADAPGVSSREHEVLLRAGQAERNRLVQQWDAAKAGYS